MKTLLIILLLLPLCSAAQKDNIVRNFSAENINTIRINNNANNFTIKVWDKKEVQMSTYIEPNEFTDLEKYSFSVKDRAGVLKIEVALKDENTNGNYNNTNAPKGNWNKQLKNKQLLKDSLKRQLRKEDDETDALAAQVTAQAYEQAAEAMSIASAYCGNTEDITIMIPANIAVEITNNAGNANIEDNLGKVQLTCNSGNINTKDITDLELDARFSNFEMGNIQTAEINANSSNFTTGNINTLTIDTRFSNYEMGDINTFALQGSQSDNFEMEKLHTLNGSFSFSTFRIQHLLKHIDVNANSGSVKIRNLEPTVTTVKIDGKYSDVDLNAKPLPSYTLTAKTKYSSLRSNGKTLESTNDDEPVTDTKGNGGKTKIDIICNSCSVTIK